MHLSLSPSKRLLLAAQHTLAMFGSTVLVPFLTGLDPSLALLTAGVGTLAFHFVTKRKVPVFLGSSFAFIAAIKYISETQGLGYATGGVMAAGVVHALLALLVYFVGGERIRSFFPPLVSGPIIMVIGLHLSPVAVSMAKQHWGIAIITLATVLLTSVFAKGFLKLLPILTGVVVGLLTAFAFGQVETAPVVAAPLFALPHFTMPQFSLSAILAIAPIAVVTMVEHIGDVTTNSAIIGQDLLKDPGLHRTLLGDGIASMIAGALGGPTCTTYAENTGVLAVTKVYDPAIIRIAAVFAIIMSGIGKLGAFLRVIPQPVMGGISMVLFGMIASIGVRTLVDNRVNLANSRNLVIVATILVLGLGGATLPLGGGLELGGMALAAIVGVVLNKLFPERLGESEAEAAH